MPPLRLRFQTLEVGDLDIHLRTLRDRSQFLDPERTAEELGISSAAWPLFGVLWDSGRVLGQLMSDQDIAGMRILEVGCGIGLASLVLSLRGADVTATDQHPEARSFLLANVALNGGRVIPFVRTGWADADVGLGRFDLIIGSDLLYEHGHAAALSGFIERHAQPAGGVILVDPGRAGLGGFGTRMVDYGYGCSRRALENPAYLVDPFRGQVLTCTR